MQVASSSQDDGPTWQRDNQDKKSTSTFFNLSFFCFSNSSGVNSLAGASWNAQKRILQWYEIVYEMVQLFKPRYLTLSSFFASLSCSKQTRNRRTLWRCTVQSLTFLFCPLLFCFSAFFFSCLPSFLGAASCLGAASFFGAASFLGASFAASFFGASFVGALPACRNR